MATVSVVPPGGLDALQFSKVAPWQEHAAHFRRVGTGNQTGKFLGLDLWKKSGCKLLVQCGCFFHSRGRYGRWGNWAGKRGEGCMKADLEHRHMRSFSSVCL